MKKKIAILGSTGSIGKNTLKVIKKLNKDIEISILSTNKNINEIIKQAKYFKVRNIIINDLEKFNIAKSKLKKSKINIFNNYKCIDKIFKNKKIDYSMISISGLDGLKPTLQMAKYSKNLAVVNKESLICGWNLIKKKLQKNNTNFIPIDSEHFSIFSLFKNREVNTVDKIYIIAQTPFINYPLNKFREIKLKDALNILIGKWEKINHRLQLCE